MSDREHHTPKLSAAERRWLEQQIGSSSSSFIPRQSGSGPFPASYSQARLWFLDELYEHAPVYNEAFVNRLIGNLDVGALRQAFSGLLARHEVLRSTFVEGDDGPQQIVKLSQPFHLPLTDLRHLDKAQREQRWQRMAREIVHKPFDLSKDVMIRGHLFRLADNEHILLQVKHHIATDGWSESIIRNEIKALYEAALLGQPSPLEPLPIQYKDYAVWQQSAAQKQAQEKGLQYWKNQLQGIRPLELPSDFPRPLRSQHSGGLLRLSLTDEQLNKLDTLARKERVTRYMALLAVFTVLLQKYANQDDIPVGTPVANRASTQTEDLVGFFVNTVVMRNDLSGNPSFRDLLKRVREVTYDALDHQDAPFEQVIGALQPERHLSRNPLFQVLFQVTSYDPPPTSMGEVAVEREFTDFGIVKFDLEVSFFPVDDKLVGRWRYSDELFNEATARRVCDHYLHLLDSALANPDLPIASLNMLGQDERRKLLRIWNDTATPYDQNLALHHMLEQSALRQPEATAVRYQERSLSYAELNRRANRLARHLQKRGLRPGTAVAVAVERSPAMLIAVLAVLKAGGAYLPIDPAYPRERQRFMLADSGAAFLLTTSDLLDTLTGDEVHPVEETMVVLLDREEAWQDEEEGDLNLEPAPEQPAYILYTSGSTGMPKGVAMSHRALSNLLQWQARDERLGCTATTLQYAPLSFDVSCRELFSTWLGGGTLVLVDEETRRDPLALLALIEYEGVERLFMPYVALQFLAIAARGNGIRPRSLRAILSAGEQLHLTEDIRWLLEQLPDCRLHNHYGLTECPGVISHTLEADSEKWPAVAPIGKPIANTRIYLLDNYQQPVAVGIPGELYIGGDALAEGYWRRPDLTAERFIADPFNPGERLYRTSDLARWLPDGGLQFIGREDEQVKLRGYRVELEEVATALRKHDQVAEAVAVVSGEGSAQRLVAFVVPTGETAVTEQELRALLARKLPEYMLPAHYLFLEALPLTPSGKSDRKALAEMEVGPAMAAETYVAPRTANEKELAAIWEEVLGVERVGLHDNFFELGGHSLLAIQAILLINEKLHVKPPVRVLFEGPTIAEMAAVVLAQQVEDMDDAKLERLLGDLE